MVLPGLGPCDRNKYCEEIRQREFAQILDIVEKNLSDKTRSLITIAGPRAIGKSCSLHFISDYVRRRHNLLWIPLATHRLGSFSQVHTRLTHFLTCRGLLYVMRRFLETTPEPWDYQKLLHKLIPEESQIYVKYEIYRAFDRLLLYIEKPEMNPFLLYNAVRTIQPFLDALIINFFCHVQKFSGVLLTLDDLEHCWRVWAPLQRMRFWKRLMGLMDTIKPPSVLFFTADGKLTEDIHYFLSYYNAHTRIENVYFESLSTSDISMICKRYLNGIDSEQKELFISRLRKLRIVSLRTILQVLHALSFSVDWQKTLAAALEVAQRILTEQDKLIHRKLVYEMKNAVAKKFGVKPSDKEILLAVKWPRDKENLRRILKSLPPDLEAAIDRKIAEWFKHKGLSVAFEKVRSTKTCPWCKRLVKSPIAYNFLVHLRWCSIASSSTHILGFRQYEVDSLLQRLSQKTSK